MCGIFGYIGRQNKAGKIILSGLKQLEYRGYDSWGISVANKKKVIVEKKVGKIGQASISLPKSTIGIGHTRWATHGGVSYKNAHPHTDCKKKIALIHNGIIENFEELKKSLVKKGHKFLSETDTEIVAHLIEEEMKKKNFVSSVRNAFLKLSGMNAIVAMHALSSTIVAVKNGSPIVIGKKNDEYYIASDATGILEHTKEVLFLEDQNMAILNHDLKLVSLKDNKKKVVEFETIKWSVQSAEKGKFKHYFLKEIFEEPFVIENIALNSPNAVRKLSSEINKAFGTFLIACGSASYAATAATYLFSKIAKKHVNFSVGSEFKYIEDFVTKKTLVVPISQSGESIDVIEPVSRVKKQKGVRVVSVVNALGSTLYRLSDFNVMLNCGPEKAVVATKSFIAMMSILIMTAFTVAGQQKQGQQLLKKASKNISEILQDGYIKKVKKTALKLKNKEHVYIIGRGLSYTAALEATLKLKEASYIHAEAFPGGELKHGVIALIEKGTPCIVFAPNDETFDEIISNAQEIKARGGYIIGIGPKNSTVFDEHFPTRDIKEATILPQISISHLLGYYLALAKGNKDPDKPRNLAKSVTVK